jgi:hypothetical protein
MAPQSNQTWHDKLHCGKTSQIKVIDKPFAGIPAGAVMYISTPFEIHTYLQHIPAGDFITPQRMRNDLAQKNNAEYTCPVSTGTFLRIATEAAYEQHQLGSPINDIAPFWRVIAPDSNLAKKLTCGVDFLVTARSKE